jgi:hypothetical protein
LSADNSGDDCDDCAGTPNGDALVDECGTCDSDSSNDCVQDCAGTWGGSSSEDDCGVCDGGNADMDSCGVCYGDGSSCLASLSLGTFDSDGSLEILYDFGGGVAGFQVDVTGLALTGASGGAAEAAGFTVSTGGNTVLGFSFTGASIPAGSGVLTVLSFDSVTEDSTELTLGNFGAVTDASGDVYTTTASGSIDHPSDCAGDYYGDSVVDNCETCDADSSNDCVQDCVGTWGGDLELDDCGVCDGGNADQDCAGVCFGDSLVDGCGVCDDDSSNDDVSCTGCTDECGNK